MVLLSHYYLYLRNDVDSASKRIEQRPERLSCEVSSAIIISVIIVSAIFSTIVEVLLCIVITSFVVFVCGVLIVNFLFGRLFIGVLSALPLVV